jgi:hypothetical protein
MIPGLRILILSDKDVEGFYHKARTQLAQSYGNVTVTTKGEDMQLCTSNPS